MNRASGRKWILIHYLRACAALLVVVHHIPTFLMDHGVVTPWSFEIGAVGVDLFFVISGFVMAQSARALVGLRDAIDFSISRVVRIVPLYWAVTLAIGVPALCFPELFRTFTTSWDQVLSSLFFIPYFDDTGALRPVVVQGWTLNYEMFFYLTIAIAISVGIRSPVRVAAFLMIFLGIVGSTLERDAPEPVGVYLSPIVIEFAAGVFLGSMFSSGRWSGQRRNAFLGLVLVILGAFVVSVASADFGIGRGSARLVVWGGAAFIFVAGLLLIEAYKIPPIYRALNVLADSSYALYLTHGLAFTVSWRLGADSIGVSLVSAGILLFAALFAGVVCHYCVEGPLCRLSNRLGRGVRDYARRRIVSARS